MKKLVTTTGGHPLRLDDISLIQAATIESLQGLGDGMCSSYSSTGVYLSGCMFMNAGNPVLPPFAGGTTVTAGYIYYNGQIYPVDAQAIPTLGVGESLYWQIQQEVLAPSPATYQDTTVHNVHIREKAVPVNSVAPPANSFVLASVLRLQQVTGAPQYSIHPYYGPTTNFESSGVGKYGTSAFGYALCDGGTNTLQTGGTFTRPDFRGRFLVGYENRTGGSIPSHSDAGYGTVTANKPSGVGGEKTHLLTSAESGLPAHQHDMRNTGSNNGVKVDAYTVTDGAGSARKHLFLTSDEGAVVPPAGYDAAAPALTRLNNTADASAAHNNIPPYHNILYIIKLY
jgi:microcystin-dependent protein